MYWFAWYGGQGLRAAFRARAGVGDGQGEGFELGDELAEPAVVGEPLPVVVELVAGDEPGDGLAVDLAGPLPVGAVQDGRVGVAAAAGLAAADVPLDEGAGQGEAEAASSAAMAAAWACWRAVGDTLSMVARRGP